MKRTSRKIKAVLLATLFFALVLPVDVRAYTYNIISDTTWTVTDASGTFLGNAQNVCLNATSPSNCPSGATLYGYTVPGWAANISSIPGATWIWAPNITGATTSAANATFTFQKEFYLCDVPTGGTIAVAADDFADVFLNGGAVPVLTSTTHAALSSATIQASSLAKGMNIIQIKVKNGLDPSDCPSGQYQCNPAGVVFGASFMDALSQLPTCTGNNGKTYTVGQFEPLSCPAGQTGSAARPCVCIGSIGVWGPVYSSCQSPPPTCTGTNGTTFNAGATETLPCPAGQTGSQTRTCGANGTWGPTTSSCAPPPVTCTGADGQTYNAGATETLSCPAGQVGSMTRICGANGSWGPTSSTCALPVVGAGAMCGSTSTGYTATCPSGTTCQSRLSPPGPRPWYCVIFGIGCPVRLQTTDWFCDP